MIITRKSLSLIRTNPIRWRQFSSSPEGSPSNWTDDIRRVNQHPEGGKEDDDGVERAKEASNTLVDLAKEGTVKTIDAGLELGVFAKKTMDVVWDAAKDSAKNLRDAVTGDDRKRGVR